jgi:diguanylate cyclase (GGDEF)-like protein
VGKGGIDLVLLDAMMPRLSGLDACRVLKGMTADGFLPVIIATVKTDPSSRVEGLKIGADDYVCKPFEEGELLARVAAMVRIKRLYDDMQQARATLERVSVHDELTGLHNYRYLQGRLTEEFKRAERQHEPLACCVLDVDRLKMHNDAGGRALGDAVLRGVADVIKRSVREADVVVRYGGDEFLVVLPATHFAGSLSVAERIWRDVAAIDWAAPGVVVSGAGGPSKSLARATVSVGVALYPTRDVRAKDALLKAADAALLHAKREGSNRICVFQQQGFIYTPNTAAPDKGPVKRSRSPYPPNAPPHSPSTGSRKRDG